MMSSDKQFRFSGAKLAENALQSRQLNVTQAKQRNKMTTYPTNISWVRLQRVVLGCLCFVTIANQAMAQDSGVPPKPAIGKSPEAPIAQKAEGFHSTTHWNVDRKTDFLKVGTFERTDPNGQPEGWDDLSAFEADHAAVRKGQLSLHSDSMTEGAYISTSVDLPPDAKFVTIEVKFRGPSIDRGATPAANAGAGVVFSMLTADGQRRKLPRIDVRYQGYRNWKTKFKTVRVLPKETKLDVRVELSNAKGWFDVARINAYASTADGEPTKKQMQLLQDAIYTDNEQAVEKLIKADPTLLETRLEHCDNGSPITYATWADSPKVIKKLVELGADIESKDYNWGNTPLQWSGYFGRAKAAKALLESGAAFNRAAGYAKGQRNSKYSASRTPKEFDEIIEMIAKEREKRAKADQE